MSKIYAILCCCLLFFTGLNLCSGQVIIDAEFRPRTEWRSGFSQPLPDTLKSSFLTLQRTRLNLSYTSGTVNARLTLQDARVFGETDTKQPASATTGSLGVYEAWVELLLTSGTSFKIGRQGVQFEDGRLFSLSPWSNTGNAHDLMMLQYVAKNLKMQVAYAFNNQKALNADTVWYSVSKMYRQLAFLHLTKTFTHGFEMSLLGVDEGFHKSKTDLDLYHRYTAGGTLQLKDDKNPLGFLFTAYHQFGKSTSDIDLDAWLLALKATYAFTDKFGGLAGVDYYSGSKKDLAATKTNTFNKLPYGVNHSFNGYMEYWATLPKGGLTNYFCGINLKINRKLSSDITYYGFQLTKGMKTGDHDIPRNIGSEVDLVLNYKFSPAATIQMAWCGYFDTKGTDLLKYKQAEANTKFPQYAYLMLTIKPQFYKTPSL